MRIDEFSSRVRSQPEVRIERVVHVAGPSLRALLAEKRPIAVLDYVRHPDQRPELRTIRFGHRVGRGLSRDTIDDWQARHPEHRIPDDLRHFLEFADGVHLWADLDRGRAYFGILPLAEWVPATESELALPPAETSRGQLVISYHDNGDYVLVLDTIEGSYRWLDHEVLDRPKFVARSVEELLDVWWDETMWLAPRDRNT